jgi:hypothetical protein
VLGASGYSGQEFIRLALAHPGLNITALVSREYAGRPASELLPGADARAVELPSPVAPDALPGLLAEGVFDTLVSCLPHGAFKKLLADHPTLIGTQVIVDLSSDFRDSSNGFVYGLPEAFRDSLAGATRIANPGCYPTAATLSLLPALEAGWLGGPVTITALSGVSGAGRAPSLRTSFTELDGGGRLLQGRRGPSARARDGAQLRSAVRRRGAGGVRAAARADVARHPADRDRTARQGGHARAGARRLRRTLRGRDVRARVRSRHVARDAPREGVEPLRPRGHHGARRPHAARHCGHR